MSSRNKSFREYYEEAARKMKHVKSRVPSARCQRAIQSKRDYNQKRELKNSNYFISDLE